MRITRFRVASMIAILGCGAAWSASTRAQTGSQPASPSSINSQPVQAIPSQGRELSVPKDAQPSQGRKKQVIDLRSRIATNPSAVRGQAISSDQQLQQTQSRQIPLDQNSPGWVDAAIPGQMFEQAQMAPRQAPAVRNAIESESPSKAMEKVSSEVPMVPRDLAPPVRAETPQPVVQDSSQERRSLPAMTPLGLPEHPQPQQVEAVNLGSSSQAYSSGSLTLPEPSATATSESEKKLPEVVGIKDALRGYASSSTAQGSDETRVPGQTYTPRQAIPAWIDVPVAQEVPVKTRSNTQQPAVAVPNQTGLKPNDSQSIPIVPNRGPTAASPSQVIPDWIYGQAGAQPPNAEPSGQGQTQGQTQPNSLPQVTEKSVVDSYGLSTQSVAPPLPQNNNPSAPGLVPRPNVETSNQLPTVSPTEPQQQSETKPALREAEKSKPKPDHTPKFALPPTQFPERDPLAGQVGYCPDDFSNCSGPTGSTFDPNAAAHVYRGKFAITTQRPLVELWRPLYTGGVYAPAPTWFGATNPMKPHFMVYGDMRTAVGVNHNSKGKSNAWGNVLNLDMDLQLTSTERIHAFVSPLNNGAQASGVSFNEQVDIVNGTNFNFNTLFFEGDAGAILGGARGSYPPLDLPFTFGLIPLIYQNGVWANDAMLGAAVALPARHSRLLKWSNFDATMFWATDNVSTDAFPGRDSAADVFGTAWFIDAYEGYIEADYAFVNDNTGSNLGYHNFSMAFTRRYLSKLSNSVRFIINAGQHDLAPINRTADGHLLLIENSFISAYPNTIVPYVNLFYGQGRPQSLARAGIAGGILNNTGINFETDGITGYPTLDPTGSNAYGFASGINILGSQFSHQLVLEFAMLQATGSRQLRNAVGDEYGLGVRYQKPLSHNLIFRTDHMVGFREEATNITGSRFELRWKF